MAPSTGAQVDVYDSHSEELYFQVPEAREADMSRAVAAARQAFDDGPWPSLTHAGRADHLRAMAKGLG